MIKLNVYNRTIGWPILCVWNYTDSQCEKQTGEHTLIQYAFIARTLLAPALSVNEDALRQ